MKKKNKLKEIKKEKDPPQKKNRQQTELCVGPAHLFDPCCVLSALVFFIPFHCNSIPQYLLILLYTDADHHTLIILLLISLGIMVSICPPVCVFFIIYHK